MELWLDSQVLKFIFTSEEIRSNGTPFVSQADDALGARQHLSLERLQEHLATQARLLDAASALVKPGGRLIYATCSVLAAENRGQIAAFLGRPGGAAFTPLAISDIWAATIAAPCPPTPDAYLDLAPDSTGTDGFFVAVLERG